jgi:hypothetical protein
MSVHSQELEQQVSLRLRAQTRLSKRSKPVEGASGVAAALGVLLEMAASPATAADALAVLHELQVHQVELALQSEELRATVAVLEEDMALQVQRYDCAPVAQFTVDAKLRLLEVNLTGAQLLSTDREALFGQQLDAFLTGPSASALRELLASADTGHGIRSCELSLTRGAQAHRLCHAAVSIALHDGQHFVTLMAT